MIILIDDDETFGRVMSKALSQKSHPCIHFLSPPEFLNSETTTDSVETLLLDLKLGDDSGLRWIKKLKSALPNSRLILLTGYASIATAVEAIKLGADDYLPKPITAAEIIQRLSGFKQDSVDNPPEKPMSVERLEWEHLQRILAENDGNISATARALGMHRRTLQRKLNKRPTPE